MSTSFFYKQSKLRYHVNKCNELLKYFFSDLSSLKMAR